MTQSELQVTPAIIKKWAYKLPKQAPLLQLEDVNVFTQHADMLLSLISDLNCPQREYILNCLYLLVGHSVSTHTAGDMQKINALLDKVTPAHGPAVLNWAARSKVILRDLRKYDYVEWCEGGFVHKDLSLIQ